jgi:beta-glucanase (GH16 family)
VTTTYYNYLGQPMPVSADPGANGVHASGVGQTITAPAGPSALYAYDTSGAAFNGDTFIGSNGDNTFYVNNVTDVVQVAAGLSGIKSIVSWAGGYTLPANVQDLTFFGAGNWGAGNSLNNLIIMGGNDHATLDGGGGADVLVGGLGENDFQLEAGLNGGSHDVFYGFHPQLDTVRISAANFTSFAQIQSAMQQVGSDVVLTIDQNDSITFRNMTIAQFQPQNFLLPLDTSQLGPMTFDDEFDSLQLWNGSTGHWNTNFGGDLTKLDAYAITSNDEKQLYTAPNFVGQNGWNLSAYNPFSISGGVLNITAGAFSYADSQHTWGQAFYSGMLNTRGLFAQKYGYFELRASLPADLGSWPAFWLSQDPYQPGVEADVLEHLAMYPDVNFERADDAGAVTGHTTYMPSLSGFHTYGMLWTPTTTTFYIDDLAVMQAAAPASWTKPMYMILDMALGGWGGPIDGTALPAQMKVDYVRVYGLADGSTNPPPPTTLTGNSTNNFTATFEGVVRQYAVGAGGATVTGGPEGANDSLVNIHRIQFVDGYMAYSTTDTAGQVYRLYETALGRAPDPEGLAGWTSALNNGTGLQAVANAFAASAEFQTDYGALGATAFVTQLYSNALHRAPDAAGLNSWITDLNNGMSRAQVVLGFSESQEAINDFAAPVQQGLWVGNLDAAEVARLYDTMLDRLPDLAGLAGWTNALEDGANLLAVVNGFIGSAEFQAAYGALDNTGFVTQLYENALHRAPDTGGLNAWVAELNSGVSRAQVVLGFSDSAEHIADTASHIDYGIWLAG